MQMHISSKSGLNPLFFGQKTAALFLRRLKQMTRTTAETTSIKQNVFV